MTSDKLCIVRALTHMAWADGTLDEREEAMLRKLYPKLGLTGEETEAALLKSDDAPDLEELPKLIPGKAGRYNLMKMFLELSFADDSLTFEEFEIIEKVTEVLEFEQSELERLRQEIVDGQ
jgi:uncharacterized tellurite resistance protein B-like protein